MKRSCYLFAICLVALIFLTGCGNKGLVGKWTYETMDSYYYTFNEDKTCSYTAGELTSKCTYEDDGTRVTILYEGSTTANVFEYKIENNKLTIQDSFGSEIVYIKK